MLHLLPVPVPAPVASVESQHPFLLTQQSSPSPPFLSFSELSLSQLLSQQLLWPHLHKDLQWWPSFLLEKLPAPQMLVSRMDHCEDTSSPTAQRDVVHQLEVCPPIAQYIDDVCQLHSERPVAGDFLDQRMLVQECCREISVKTDCDNLITSSYSKHNTTSYLSSNKKSKMPE